VSEESAFNAAVQADAAGREHVALKLQTEYASQFGYNPLVLMSVVVAPLVLVSLGVSPYFYLPGALLLLSYLKAKQERHDRKSAMGIIDDVNVRSACGCDSFTPIAFTQIISLRVCICV
jgi:hypothetical protein